MEGVAIGFVRVMPPPLYLVLRIVHHSAPHANSSTTTIGVGIGGRCGGSVDAIRVEITFPTIVIEISHEDTGMLSQTFATYVGLCGSSY